MKICPTCNQEYPDDQRFCQNDGTTLRSPSGTDLIGSVIADRYHITQKLGEGGMGAVYLGNHVKMQRLSAIKVMHQAMADDADAIARFNREAANAARISHPNVCGIYDFGETEDGLIYLAMEFIEGKALTEVLEHEGALPPKRAAEILRQTAEALQAAHDLGIVHRDLKPDNIMIVAGRDDSDMVKVVDFGIAKAMGSGSAQKVTKTGLVVGTPEYMSPEQLSGDHLDGRSDIYSLGLVLFRMLTGQLPFTADTAQEVMIMRLTDDPKTLAQAVPGVEFPNRLQRALDRALARMPTDRYASASSFGRDVAAAVSAMPDAPSPVDATRPVSGSSAETRDADRITAGLPDTQMSVRPSKARTLAAGDGPPPTAPTRDPGVPSEPDTPPIAPPAPVSHRRSSTKVMAAVAGIVLIAGVGGTAWVVTRNGDDPADTLQLASNQDSVIGGTTMDTADADLSNERQDDPGTIRTMDSGNGSQGADQTGASGGQPSDTTTPIDTGPGVGGGPAIGNAEADEILVTLLDRMTFENPSAAELVSIRDSAVVFFEEARPNDLKATAAYVIATAWAKLDDRTRALDWARQATRLDPDTESYRRMVDDLTGNPQ